MTTWIRTTFAATPVRDTAQTYCISWRCDRGSRLYSDVQQAGHCRGGLNMAQVPGFMIDDDDFIYT